MDYMLHIQERPHLTHILFTYVYTDIHPGFHKGTVIGLLFLSLYQILTLPYIEMELFLKSSLKE